MFNLFLIKATSTYIGKRKVSLINGAKKLDIQKQQNETRSLSLMSYNSSLKMD
jgi:hypothetical protein